MIMNIEKEFQFENFYCDTENCSSVASIKRNVLKHFDKLADLLNEMGIPFLLKPVGDS